MTTPKLHDTAERCHLCGGLSVQGNHMVCEACGVLWKTPEERAEPPKLHDAAVRAAEKFLTTEQSWSKGGLAEVISATIDAHLNSINYQEMMELLTGTSLCEGCAVKRASHLTGKTKRDSYFNHRLKSEGWEELREAAEETILDASVKGEMIRLRKALRRVRGEKP